jgi:hypothetical protein
MGDHPTADVITRTANVAQPAENQINNISKVNTSLKTQNNWTAPFLNDKKNIVQPEDKQWTASYPQSP